MTSGQFVTWLKGFTEACEGLTASPKQWEKIKEVLNDVEDYNDYGDLDEEIDDWYGESQIFKTPLTGSGTITTPSVFIGNSPYNTLTITSGSSGTANLSATVWNDKMGCWHYTNYPEGFGYYFNSQDKKKKND